MINGLTLNNLRNSEFAQFMTDTLELVKRNDPVALQVEATYNALLAENEVLTNLLKPEKGSPLTAQLEAADDRRDAAVTGINLVVSGFTTHPDPAISSQALTLQRHLALFGSGSLARENYQSETAGINSLVADWTNKPELAAAITALNLDGWKAELAEANKAFNDLYLSRTESDSTANPVGVRAQRQRMAPLYYELRDLIVSYHTITKGAAPYGHVVNLLNALIERYNTLLSNRRRSGGTAE